MPPVCHPRHIGVRNRRAIIGGVTQFDLAALALLVVFAYGGYRRGLIVFTLNLAGGVLALALAAVVAPAIVPYIVATVRLPETLARPLLVVAFTLPLRHLFGYAVRELATALRALLKVAPPLAVVDRLLGVGPGLALGSLVVAAIALAALRLPLGPGVHDAVAQSWIARAVLDHPERVIAAARRLWQTLVVDPPSTGMQAPVMIATGVAGLWLGAFAAYRLRREGGAAPRSEATTRRSAAPPRFGALPEPRRTGRRVEPRAETADPLAWPRAAAGLAAAALMATLLIAFIRLTG